MSRQVLLPDLPPCDTDAPLHVPVLLEQVALDATDVEAADNDRSPSRTGDGRLRAPTYAPQVDRPGQADGFCGMRGPSPR